MKFIISSIFAFFFIQTVVYGKKSAVDDVFKKVKDELSLIDDKHDVDSIKDAIHQSKARFNKLLAFKCEAFCKELTIKSAEPFCKGLCTKILGLKIDGVLERVNLSSSAFTDKKHHLKQALHRAKAEVDHEVAITCEKDCDELEDENQTCKNLCNTILRAKVFNVLASASGVVSIEEQMHRIEDAAHAIKAAKKINSFFCEKACRLFKLKDEKHSCKNLCNQEAKKNAFDVLSSAVEGQRFV